MEILPLKTWQFYAACKKILGDTFLHKLFSRSPRQVYRWSADPDFASDTERNPMDRYETLLRRLLELGRRDIAVSAVARQAFLLDCELTPIEPGGEQLKPSIAEECLDDLAPLAEYHRILQDRNSTLEVVRAAWQGAKNELNQNYELWIKSRPGPRS